MKDLNDIDKTNGSSQIDVKDEKSSKIFISHSSKDKEYAESLVLLLTDLGISKEKILCTSVSLTAIEIGTHDFLDYLKINLKNTPLFICLFSENYINSPMCLCEMGAAWITSKEQRLILTPETDFSLASTTVLGRNQGLKLDDNLEIVKLIDQLKEKFVISKSHFEITLILKKYLENIENIKKKIQEHKIESVEKINQDTVLMKNIEEINQDTVLMKNIRKDMDIEIINFKNIGDIREIKTGTLNKLFSLKDKYIDNEINYTFYDEKINKIAWDFIKSIDIFENFYLTYTFSNGSRQLFLDGMKFRKDYDSKLKEYINLYIDILKSYEELQKISKEKLRVLRVE